LGHGILLSQEHFLPHFPNKLQPMFWYMNSEKCLCPEFDSGSVSQGFGTVIKVKSEK